ncbi:hypothetical protein M9H77_16607 [Catharanthus roseus]|uniref:Uncharacterized protein n=1 Tax=Catharanthus roseus TaxID=4058 RepID=A0ACC0B286_CATRO|nr:hypothetical protein M9H77_16607 [Catharanthus roseus]
MPERDLIPVVELSDGESVEGPVTQEVEFEALIEEDPSEPKSDLEMVVEPEGVALTDTEGMDSFIEGGSPLAVSLIPVLPAESASSFPSLLLLGEIGEQYICGCCIRREQRIKDTGSTTGDDITRIRIWVLSYPAQTHSIKFIQVHSKRENDERKQKRAKWGKNKENGADGINKEDLPLTIGLGVTILGDQDLTIQYQDFEVQLGNSRDKLERCSGLRFRLQSSS